MQVHSTHGVYTKARDDWINYNTDVRNTRTPGREWLPQTRPRACCLDGIPNGCSPELRYRTRCLHFARHHHRGALVSQGGDADTILCDILCDKNVTLVPRYGSYPQAVLRGSAEVSACGRAKTKINHTGACRELGQPGYPWRGARVCQTRILAPERMNAQGRVEESVEPDGKEAKTGDTGGDEGVGKSSLKRAAKEQAAVARLAAKKERDIARRRDTKSQKRAAMLSAMSAEARAEYLDAERRNKDARSAADGEAVVGQPRMRLVIELCADTNIPSLVKQLVASYAIVKRMARPFALHITNFRAEPAAALQRVRSTAQRAPAHNSPHPLHTPPMISAPTSGTGLQSTSAATGERRPLAQRLDGSGSIRACGRNQHDRTEPRRGRGEPTCLRP